MPARPTKIIAWNPKTKQFERLWTDNKYRVKGEKPAKEKGK